MKAQETVKITKKSREHSFYSIFYIILNHYVQECRNHQCKDSSHR